MDVPPPAQAETRVTLGPMLARANVTYTGGFVGPILPWQAPALFGAHAHPRDDPAAERLVIINEWPIPHWAVIGDRLPKEAVERMHLDRYFTDHLLATGELPYVSLAGGSDPPDFRAVDRDGTALGVDATRLAVSNRIGAQEEFERIRRAVLAQPRLDVAHLAGHLIYVWLTDDTGDIRLPHRKPQQVQEVVDALRDYIPDVSWTKDPQVVRGEQLGDTDIRSTPSGCTFYAAELVGAAPSTQFFAATGFELALAFQSEHAHDAAWAELSRLVAKHDKAEIDHLIVTVAGPNERGLSYPSESLLLDAALHAGLPRLSPEHLSRVVLHSWTDGRIITLHPEPSLRAPLYPGGYFSPHYSLIAPPQP